MPEIHQADGPPFQTQSAADGGPFADAPAPPKSREPGSRRRWPLLLIGASAGTATWSGWVGLGELTGFGVVHPLPGIWDDLTLNTAITLPIGVEAYAVYALAVATDHRPLTRLARRWAWASAAGALLLGMGGQIAYHLLAARDVATAPAWVVALVSSLPVLVLGAASLLWHLAAVDPGPTLDDTGDTAADHRRPAFAARSESSAVGVSVSVVPDPHPNSASTIPPGGPAPYPAPVPVETGHGRRPSPALPAVSALTPTAASDAPDTPTTVAVSGVSGAVASRGPSRSRGARTTMPVPAASDDVLLAQLDALPGNEDLPSIRALMRDHGIGQARATRIHREATARRERRHSAADLGGRGQAAPPDRSTPTPERHEPTGQSEQPEPAADVAKEQRAPYDDDTDEAHETDHQDEHQVSRTTTEEESEESPIKIHN